MITKFITFWALDEGIWECERTLYSPSDDPTQWYIYDGCYVNDCHVHDTLEEAKIKAEEMRLAKIERVKVNLTNLENLRF